VQALTEMVKWVGRASPNTVVTYKEEDARAVWQQAYAAFMRNWPYAYSLGNKVYKENKSAYSEIVGEFDVHAVLPGGSNKVGHSCVGGWQLGINARSNNPDAAWTFMQYMLSQPAQRIAALNGSLTVTLKSVYEDSDVLDKHPFFGTLQPIFQNARSRPVSLKYADITKAIQGCVYQALTKASSPASALSTLQNNLQQIVSS
jgi:ABC-type glycerol-3-phosphate transport system substrate-binding protein